MATAAAQDASSGLSSPGPDSEGDQPGGIRAWPGADESGTPLRSLAPGARPGRVKDSPGLDDDEDEDGQPARKKRIRRTRADLEADRRAAELYPSLYDGKKNPKPKNPYMKRPPLPGEPGYQHNPSPARLAELLNTEQAPGPSIVMSPYTASLAPEPRRESSSYGVPNPATTPTTAAATVVTSGAPPGHFPLLLDQSPLRNGYHHSTQHSPTAPPHSPYHVDSSRPPNFSPRSTHYDPIRGFSSNDVVRSNPVTATASPQLKMATATLPNRASASPAISSLIDPPEPHAHQPPQAQPPPPQGSGSLPPSSSSTPYSKAQALPSSRPAQTADVPPKDTIVVSHNQPLAASSDIVYPSSTPADTIAEAARPALPTVATRETAVETAMDVDPAVPAATKPYSSHASISSGPSPQNGPAKVKEKREKPPLPPLPGSGSGLLTSQMLGVSGPNSTAASVTGGEETKTAPVINISISLDTSGNNIFNFGRLAEREYGFDALHPRLAAQKARLARVAAAGAMLENEARARAKGLDPDAMSEDLDGGSDDEKNADLSNAEQSGPPGNEPPKRKKRNFKEDNYDKDDPFVDDSELGLEEQAALATDGFFVYCGPIVDENRPPTIQGRPDGLSQPTGRGRGRGRGRGGGPGSRGGKVPGVEGSGTGRGGGPGSRGGRGRGRGRGRGAANAAGASAQSSNQAGARPSTATKEPAATQSSPSQSHGASSSKAELMSFITTFHANESNAPTKSTASAASNGYAGSPGRHGGEAIIVD